MDFAKRQLLKYGWTEGKGLGKDEDGMAQAIKPKLKFDTTGVGHDTSEQFTNNWWENVYNNAANNINVIKTESGAVNVKLNSEESVNITTKKYSLKHLNSEKGKLEYGSFLKSSTLTSDGIVDYEDKMIVDEPIQETNSTFLTDEELFAVCGRRTAHKGARHGLKLNGKLSRIEEQERLLFEKLNTSPNESQKKDISAVLKEMSTEKKLNKEVSKIANKKSKKNKDRKYDSEEDNVEYKKRKKSKKRSYSDDDEQLLELEAQIKYMHKKEKKEKKKVTKIANMLENVCVIDPNQNNKDDGFDESSKEGCKVLHGDFEEEKQLRKKCKKAKKKRDTCEDDGFEECINEVSEKLMFYKELRKELHKEKQKGDERRISEMSDAFEAKL